LTRARIENIWLQRPVIVIGVTLILCALSADQIRRGRVKFDYNLMQMQSPSLSSVKAEQLLIQSAGKSILFGAILATNLDDAIRLEKEAQILPTAADVEPPPEVLENFIQSNQAKKEPLVSGIKIEVGPVTFSPPDLNPVNLNELSATLYSLYGYSGDALEAIGTNDPALSEQFNLLREAILNFRTTMLAGGEAGMSAHSQKLADFQQAFFNDVRNSFNSVKDQNTTATLRVEDLPQTLRNQFIGKTGKFLVQVYPKEDVWQRSNQEKFVADLRTIDMDATGARPALRI